MARTWEDLWWQAWPPVSSPSVLEQVTVEELQEISQQAGFWLWTWVSRGTSPRPRILAQTASCRSKRIDALFERQADVCAGFCVPVSGTLLATIWLVLLQLFAGVVRGSISSSGLSLVGRLPIAS
eukprot:3414714-Amphidinium_carterae.1